MYAPAGPCVTHLAPTTAVTKDQVVGMGSDLVAMLTEEQMWLAVQRYSGVDTTKLVGYFIEQVIDPCYNFIY